MSKILVIAEKSEVGKAIDQAIRKNNYKPQNIYRITAASGHLLGLKPPEAYDPALKTWTIEGLPIAFPHWEQVPKQDTEKTNGMYQRKLDSIRDGLNWCDMVIHAGDPDDEGQLIVDELLDHFGNTKPVRRLDVNDSTEKYILKKLDETEDNDKFRRIGRSAYARTVADAMFGFNFSRFYTISCNSQKPLSVGRVQTPTLGLVVNRDREIENHIQQTYYILQVQAKSSNGIVFPMTYEVEKSDPRLTDGKFMDKSILEPIASTLEGQRIQANVSKTTETDAPPLPFNLVELQAYCNRQYGLAPDETHNITQVLRDKYKCITYNRSSCQYLHEIHHAEAPAVMQKVLTNLQIQDPGIDYSIKSKCFNDKYLQNEPHHAIIPTQTDVDISAMAENERVVYKAICDYYIAQFLPPRKRLKTTVRAEAENGKLICSTSEVKSQGFYSYLRIRDNDSEDQNSGNTSPVSMLPEGNISLALSNPEISDHKTKPPARYTQATLIKDMTCIAKYVTDERIKKILIGKDADKQKEQGSIGTPATRDTIVSTLLKRGYLKEEKHGKSSTLISTALGRSFYDMLPDSIKCADVTAEWWQITEDIKNGNVAETALYDKLLTQIKEFLAAPPSVTKLNVQNGTTGEIIGKCPHCGGNIVYGDNGAYCSAKCGMFIGVAFGKKLTAQDVKGLLSGKVTTIKGLISKEKQKFEANVQMSGTESFEYTAKDGTKKIGYRMKLDFAEKTQIANCPHCGAPVYMGPTGPYCSSGCGMFLSSVYRKTLTAAELKKLLAGKEVRLKITTTQGQKREIPVLYDGTEPFEYKDTKTGEAKTGYRMKVNIAQDHEVGTCPKCGELLRYGQYGAYCTAKCGMGPGKILGVKIPEKDIPAVLQHEPFLLKHVPNVKGQAYDLYIRTKGIETYAVQKDGVRQEYEQFAFENVPIAKCPKCGGDVYLGTYGPYCAQRCGMYLAKLLGKSLTMQELQTLLAGEITTLKNLTSTNGKPYDAVIRMTGIEETEYTDTKTGKKQKRYQITTQWENGRKILGPCPKCGADVVAGDQRPYCTGKCGITFVRKILHLRTQLMITDKDYETLLQKKPVQKQYKTQQGSSGRIMIKLSSNITKKSEYQGKTYELIDLQSLSNQ